MNINKAKCLGKKLLDTVKNNLGKIVVFALALVLFSVAWPKSSAIYFEGTADQAEFTFSSDKRAVYKVKSYNQYNGKIVFGADKTKMFFIVDASMPEDEIQQIRKNGYPSGKTSSEVFWFKDGSATLSSKSESAPTVNSLMTLILESPDGNNFSYNMEITQSEGDGSGPWNQIELKNFPEDLIIQLHSSFDIDMKGTTKKIPLGLYRIIDCSSITFYAVPASPGDSEIGYEFQLKKALDHFQFINTERDTFEITYRAETNFIEIGHVKMEGDAQKEQELILEISDIGQYPLPVKLYGQAGALTMGGVNCYPNQYQLILDKRSELLFSIVGLYVGLAFGKTQEKKSAAKGEKRTRPCQRQLGRRVYRRRK